MFHFLVELGGPPAHRTTHHTKVRDAILRHLKAKEPPPTPRQRALLEIAKKYAAIGDPLSDEAINAQMDINFGVNKVPILQWYNLGRKNQLTELDVIDLEVLFFGGQDHEPGTIQLHQHGVDVWLRIKRARARRPRITLDEKEYRIVRAEDYTQTAERIAYFRA